ncbi:MAG TPA: type III PLP-dependent enzyme [Micromonosporaceae bacterium]
MNPAWLAERFGTPLYVYDLAKVRAAHADLRAALPSRAGLYYSLKANPHPGLVRQLAALGCRAEVCGEGELRAATLAGVDPADMLLTGPGKSVDLLGSAFAGGLRRFSVESPTDLDRVAELARRHDTVAECLLRVNADEAVPGMGLAMTGTASQFGADASWVTARPERFRARPGVRITGLHLYMGTNLTDEATLLRQFGTAAALAGRLGPLVGELTEVDLGGGFGLPYARSGARPAWPALRDQLAGLLDRHLPGWRSGSPRITFESGRYLVGESGTLVCRVLDVKYSKGQRFAVLDAGINHLGGMSGLRRLPPIVPTLLVEQEPAEPSPTTVVGPLCTPLDTLVRGAQLPPLRAGSLVCIPNVGAYGLTASLLAFLSHPAPVEVLVDGDRVVEATRLRLSRDALPAVPSPAGSVLTGKETR